MSYYKGFIPQLYKRYIDGIVGAASCRRDELEGFITHVFTFHPALQFTYTISQTQKPLLDITIRISGRIRAFVHYKDSDTHNYLHYTSSHPKHCKNSISYSPFLRLRRLCFGVMTSCRNAKRCLPFSKAVAIPRIFCRTLGKGRPPSPANSRGARETCA